MKKIFTFLMVALFSASVFAADVKLYFVNADDWEAVHAYVYQDADPWPNGGAWPGEAMNKEEGQLKGHDLYSYTFSDEYNTIIFNNNDKGSQTPNLKWDIANPYYYDGKWYATAADVEAAGEPVKNKIYFVNAGGWENVYLHTWNTGGDLKPWPGTQMTKTSEQAMEKDVYEAEIPEGYENVLFHNNAGAQTENLKFDAAKPYHYKHRWYASISEIVAPAVEDGFYLNGSHVDWVITALAPYKFVENPSTPGEYLLDNITLTKGQIIKACYVENDFVTDDNWFGNGDGNADVTIDAEKEGVCTVYFKPAGDEAWGGHLYIAPNTTTGVDNTEATVKAVKSLENGMLIIEKNGVRFNAQGQMVR